MSKQYLNLDGLVHFYGRLKEKFYTAEEMDSILPAIEDISLHIYEDTTALTEFTTEINGYLLQNATSQNVQVNDLVIDILSHNLYRITAINANILTVSYITNFTGPIGPQGDDYVLTDADKAEIAELAKDSLGVVYVFQGSVDTYADLPTDAAEGDVYNVIEDNMNYAWVADPANEGSYIWDALGEKFEVDLRVEYLPDIGGSMLSDYTAMNRIYLFNPGYFTDKPPVGVGGLGAILINSNTAMQTSQTVLHQGSIYHRYYNGSSSSWNDWTEAYIELGALLQTISEPTAITPQQVPSIDAVYNFVNNSINTVVIEAIPENADLDDYFSQTQKIWLLTGTEINGPEYVLEGGLLINGIYYNTETVQAYSQTIIVNGMVHQRGILTNLSDNTSTRSDWRSVSLIPSTFTNDSDTALSDFQANATDNAIPSTLAMVNYVNAMIEQYDTEAMALLGTD